MICAVPMKKQASQQKESANPKTMRTYDKLERRTGMNRMRTCSAVLMGLLALAVFFSCNGSAPAISPDDMADIKTVAEGNTAFAIDLYGRMTFLLPWQNIGDNGFKICSVSLQKQNRSYAVQFCVKVAS